MKIYFADHLEEEVADILDSNGIEYIHESQDSNQFLDFYLPDHDIYIEIKQFHSDRASNQLKSKDNIILLQGRKSISFFRLIFNP